MRKRTRRQRFDLGANAVRLALLPRYLTPNELRDLAILELMSLDRLARGSANAVDRRTLQRCVRIAGELAGMGIGAEVAALVPEARAAVEHAPPREGCSAAALAPLRSLLELYDSQRRLATRAEIERAIHVVVWAG